MFLIVSEPKQRDWCKEDLARNYTDVIVVTDVSSREEDLQLLTSLKHFVYSHGTFGLWGILLSDAETIVYPKKAYNVSNRYSHHYEFDMLSKNLTEIVFVTVPQT